MLRPSLHEVEGVVLVVWVCVVAVVRKPGGLDQKFLGNKITVLYHPLL